MQLRPNQLKAHLSKSLAPVYVVGGDEMLLVQEAADAIRQAALKAGYSERVVLDVETGFDWGQLMAAGASMSLFAERQLIELRLPTGKPGTEGSKSITAWCKSLPPDIVLLVNCGKLESGSRRAKWFQTLEKTGASVVAWPLNGRDVQQWLEGRMRSRGLQPDPDAVQALAERVEGNLLAAAQEVDKLQLLCGEGPISLREVLGAVTDSSRFDIFDLVDACLGGDAAQVEKTMLGLRGEGAEPVLILWALVRELRALYNIAKRIAGGLSVDRAMDEAKIWKARKPLTAKAASRLRPAHLRRLLKHSARLDRVIKGQQQGRMWDELLQLALTIATGKPPVMLLDA